MKGLRGPNPHERCKNCHFAVGKGNLISAIRCMRFPPRFIGDDGGRLPEIDQWEYPIVQPENWCGEWKQE